MKLFASNAYVLYLAVVLTVSNKASDLYGVSVKCTRIAGENNESVLEPATAETTPEEDSKAEILPNPSTDMLTMAREMRRREKAFAYCTRLNWTMITTIDGHKCVTTFQTRNETHNCTRRITVKVNLNGTFIPVRIVTESVIYITGNIISFVFLGTLLATYTCFKDLQTSYGRCIVALSVTIIIKDATQFFSTLSGKGATWCKIIAIACHWMFISMFCWMASIAYDLRVTFSRIRIQSPRAQHRKYRAYRLFSLVTPTIIVLICLAIDQISVTVIYGANGICFVSEYWANMMSFVVPTCAIVIFNTGCFVCTICFICKASKKSQSLSQNDERRPGISLAVMTVKLSLLLGLNWLLAFIGLITKSTLLLYIFLVLDAFQGMFVYFAFCCNSRVFAFYSRAFRQKIHRSGIR